MGIQCQRNTQRDTHVSTEADLNYFFKLPSGTKFSGRDPGNWLGGEGESEDIWAVLAQDIYEFNQDVDVIVGARYDSYEQAGDAFSPRVAVVWDTFFGQVLKASYGRAFAAPYSSERYFNLSGFKGNPDLKPATIDTYELALQNLMQDRFHYAIVAFHSVLADGFSDDQSAAADTPVFSNSADETFRGVEVEARWLINAQLSIWGNYSHVTAQNAQPGQILGFVEDMGNVGFSVDLAKALSLSSYAHITDDLRDQDTHIDGAVVVHAALVYSGVKNTEISLVARNLLDEEIIYANDLNSALGQPLPPLVGDGRQVLLTVKHSF